MESPGQGRGSTLSLPWLNHPGDSSVAMLPLNDSIFSAPVLLPRWNQRWDSRAERENDSIFSTPVSLPSRNQQWDSSVAALLLNDVRELNCGAGVRQWTLIRVRAEHQTVDAEAKTLRHSEAAGRGIPHGGA